MGQRQEGGQGGQRPATLAELLPLRLRLRLHLLVLVAVAFLSVYGRVVCPFIDTQSLSSVAYGLVLVAVAQLLIRELLHSYLPIPPPGGLSIPRFGFWLSVGSWLVAGLLAVLVHEWRFPDFPLGSHLKLLTGYWGMGAGLLAQLEYVVLERWLHRRLPPRLGGVPERLARRLLEGFALFTLVPGLAMVLLVVRYIYERLIIPGVAGEIVFLALFFVSIALAVAWFWGEALREDTAQLVDGLQRIGEGRFDIRLEPRRNDELGVVAQGINGMAEGLGQRERIREAFGRFVSPEVAEEFIREYATDGRAVRLGGRRREVAVLMSDLRGFTPLAEGLEPELLTELLNSYFSAMVEVIRAHGGTVDKFIGDAVMAVFGYLPCERECALSAVMAGRAMHERLAVLNIEHQARGWPMLESGVGVHVGEVIAGYFGSPDRLEFTVVGRVVNLAARIESECKPPNPPLLFSREVAERVEGELATRLVGRAQLKGVEGEVELFALK